MVLGAASIELTPSANPTSMIITPTIAMPRRPKKYAVKVEVPMTGGLAALTGSTSVEFVPATIDSASSGFYFVGRVDISRVGATSQLTLDRTSGCLRCMSNRPLRSCRRTLTVSTTGRRNGGRCGRCLMRMSTRVQSPSPRFPTESCCGVDHDWGWDVGLGQGGNNQSPAVPTSWYDQRFSLRIGSRLRAADGGTGTSSFRPVLLNWEQAREQRLMAFGHWLEKQPADAVTRKQPRVSSMHAAPLQIAYDLGGVVRDSNGLNPYVGESPSNRMPWRIEAAIEFLRTLTFAVADDYHVIWNLDDDRGRNYLEARAELNTGTLLRLDRGSLQHAITFRDQKGRQSPTFKPVDTVSVGIRLFR